MMAITSLCLLLAQNGHAVRASEFSLSGVKRTSFGVLRGDSQTDLRDDLKEKTIIYALVFSRLNAI
jgi:hypothetical protein